MGIFLYICLFENLLLSIFLIFYIAEKRLTIRFTNFFSDLKTIFFLFPIIAALLLGSLLPSSFAQFQAGGVDKEGSWYAGEGLKQGDYFFL